MNLGADSCGLIAEIDWSSMALIGFLVFVPLVPAVILYKLFEQKTVVSGPFQGLRLDLSGAFAGYFLLLLVCSGLLFGPLNPHYKEQIAGLKKQLEETSDLGTAWTVQGRLALTTRNGSNDLQMDGVEISILPLPEVLRDGFFEVRVLKDKAAGPIARLPTLQVSKFGYFPEAVHLEPLGGKLGKDYNKTIDEANRVIKIDDVIELKEDPTRPQNAPRTAP